MSSGIDRFLTFRGKRYNLRQLADLFGLAQSTLHYKLEKTLDLELIYHNSRPENKRKPIDWTVRSDGKETRKTLSQWARFLKFDAPALSSRRKYLMKEKGYSEQEAVNLTILHFIKKNNNERNLPGR